MLLKHYLRAFGSGGEVEGVLITSTQDRYGGNSARRPFSHKSVLVYFQGV